jgi:D-aminoacyl-tRNA deacylase
MRIVLQRVTRASVRIDGAVTASINKGILLLLGVHRDDTEEKAAFLAAKCAGLRIFSDAFGKMNLSCKEAGGEALLVSQFTLFGDCTKGRRPSFIEAAAPDKGRAVYEYFIQQLKNHGIATATGTFGAMMEVELVNDGPVTLLLEK